MKVKETGFGKWKIAVILIAVVVVIGAVGFTIVMRDSRGVTLTEDVTVEVQEGAGASAVADMLYDRGVIKYPLVFKLQSKLGSYDSQFQPGIITVSDGMSYNEILEALTTADRDTVTVVIPEGYEAVQIANALSEAGLPCGADFMDALDPSLYDYDFLKDLPDRKVKLEGYLFPATYKIPASYTASEVVDLMLQSFNNTFSQEYRDRAAELNMSIDDVITMASVIERETNSDSERAKVAGVFYNRINSDMKLQSCATVQYVLGEHKPVLSIADTQIDSPYNTYVYSGLPVGPICNPGEDCIKAALYPEQTDAYYFCLSKSGEHIFSKTYEEHVAAMENNDLVTSVDSSAVANEDSKK